MIGLTDEAAAPDEVEDPDAFADPVGEADPLGFPVGVMPIAAAELVATAGVLAGAPAAIVPQNPSRWLAYG